MDLGIGPDPIEKSYYGDASCTNASAIDLCRQLFVAWPSLPHFSQGTLQEKWIETEQLTEAPRGLYRSCKLESDKKSERAEV